MHRIFSFTSFCDIGALLRMHLGRIDDSLYDMKNQETGLGLQNVALLVKNTLFLSDDIGSRIYGDPQQLDCSASPWFDLASMLKNVPNIDQKHLVGPFCNDG